MTSMNDDIKIVVKNARFKMVKVAHGLSLSNREYRSISKVSQETKEMFQKFLKYFYKNEYNMIKYDRKCLHVAHIELDQDSALKISQKSLKKLILLCCHITDDNIATLTQSKSISHLAIVCNESKIDVESMKYLRMNTNIHTLNMSACNLTYAHLNEIIKMEQLTDLDINRNFYDKHHTINENELKIIEELSNHKKLKRLGIEFNTEFSNKAINIISKSQSITELNMVKCNIKFDKDSGSTLSNLFENTILRSLRISYDSMDRINFTKLTSIPSLVYLYIRPNSFRDNKFSDKIDILANNKNIKYLNLSSIHINDGDAMELLENENLISLIIRKRYIIDAESIIERFNERVHDQKEMIDLLLCEKDKDVVLFDNNDLNNLVVGYIKENYRLRML
jgi:hypothetical protein